jgi:hypothetical protein
MCDGEKVRHAWIYGGMCEIRPPVYSCGSGSPRIRIILESWIWIPIRVKGRIRIRIKVKSRIRIRKALEGHFGAFEGPNLG